MFRVHIYIGSLKSIFSRDTSAIHLFVLVAFCTFPRDWRGEKGSYAGKYRCSRYGFQTIQSKTGCINHKNFRLEQDIKCCNIYKLFSTRCKNPSWIRIGVIGFWCTWIFPESQARPLLKIHLLSALFPSLFPGIRRQQDKLWIGYQNKPFLV